MRELLAACFSKKLGHPPRWVKTPTTAMKKTQPRTTGTNQVGRRTIASKVGFGLNSTPKIRPTELSEPPVPEEGAGDDAEVGVSALAMLVSSCLNRNNRLRRSCFSLRPA